MQDNSRAQVGSVLHRVQTPFCASLHADTLRNGHLMGAGLDSVSTSVCHRYEMPNNGR